MADRTDVAIIGAGPAGLSAAKSAIESGLNVTLLDEQPAAGGQIYRAIDRVDAERVGVLGKDYADGRALLDVLSKDNLNHVREAAVWDIAADNTLFYSCNGRASAIVARKIIIATGAMERPMPFHGWQLPGVMTAGAGQIMLKSSGLLPSSPTVLAGSGPLLYLLAAQYLRAGHPIAALVETTPKEHKWAALSVIAGALWANRYLRKGLALLAEIKKSGVAHYRAATELQAVGEDRVEALSFVCRSKHERIPCSTLLIHIGVVPNVQLSRLLGLPHLWHERQRCWHPQAGPYGETTREDIYIAGDAAGIGGAEAAVQRGYLAGLHAAHTLKLLDASAFQQRSARALKDCALHDAVRPFLDTLYAPSRAYLTPKDDTIVCRCEEVTAGKIREYVALGCLGPNQTKAFGRCGMGPCQGRLCGLTVSEIIAAERNVSVSDVGYYRIRPPLKPVTLGEIADIDLPAASADESAPTL